MNAATQQMAEMLKASGIDVSKYQSLMTADKIAGEGFEIGSYSDGTNFAGRSRFYGKVMDDGYIFNPYIHRRWLPSQYLSMRRWNNLNDLYFPTSRILDLLKTEVDKMCLLAKIDKVAFNERSHFFSVQRCKEVVYKLLCKIEEDFEKAKERTRGVRYIYINNGYVAEFELIRYMKQMKEDLSRIENENVNYHIIQGILNREYMIGCYFPRFMCKMDEFYDAYLSSGAFYTLKHLIMFENKTFDGLDTKSSLQKLLNDYINCDWHFLDKLVEEI